MDPQEINKMMLDYAQEAVKMGREQFHVELDYSEHSLEQVEEIMGDLSSAMPDSATDDTIDHMCKAWGGYFGEVVRRRFGGEWEIDYYPGQHYLIVTLNVAGSKLFPSMKVNRRLVDGESENLWEFYQKIKQRLEAKPGGKIQ